MATYLTVDGGTTNTRIYLIQDCTVLDSQKLSVGARSGNDLLRSALKDGIADVLRRNSLTEKDVSCILASGMITSEYGLCNLPHATLPAGRSELHRSMQPLMLEEITSLQWYFLRGVKTGAETLADADMMRGEETELMGILEENAEDTLYVLPGSHSKHISVDCNGKITGFKTMLTGELFAAVVQSTILKDAVDLTQTESDEEALLQGFSYAQTHGINEALFKTRILRNLFSASKNQCYAFLLGVILCDEVLAISKCPETTVVLGGQAQMRAALSILLNRIGGKRVITLSDKEVARSTALGAVRIFEYLT